MELPQEAKDALQGLRELFSQAGLPSDLHLGLVTPHERSLLGLLGLLHGESFEVAIPVAFAGSGTRQLALFRLAAALVAEEPILVLDEPEAGLEPYRQRSMIADLRGVLGTRGQAFITTHSPAVVEVLKPAEISRLVTGKDPVSLDQPGITKVLVEAPDTFLCRLPVLCEGDTEAGLLEAMLPPLTSADGVESLDVAGIRLVPRHGQPEVLDEAEGILAAGMPCGLFVDAEDEHSGRRQRLEDNELCAFSSWKNVRNVEEAVAAFLPFGQLARIVDIAAEVGGRRRDSLLQQVGDSVGESGKRSLQDLSQEVGETPVRKAVCDAMSRRSWFKTRSGGEELGRLLLECGVPGEIDSVIRALWNDIQRVLE